MQNFRTFFSLEFCNPPSFHVSLIGRRLKEWVVSSSVLNNNFYPAISRFKSVSPLEKWSIISVRRRHLACALQVLQGRHLRAFDIRIMTASNIKCFLRAIVEHTFQQPHTLTKVMPQNVSHRDVSPYSTLFCSASLRQNCLTCAKTRRWHLRCLSRKNIRYCGKKHFLMIPWTYQLLALITLICPCFPSCNHSDATFINVSKAKQYDRVPEVNVMPKLTFSKLLGIN